MELLAITFELRLILQNVRRKVIGNVLINISPLHILPIAVKAGGFHHNCKAGLAAVSINGLMNPFPSGVLTWSDNFAHY